jgi:hypothetical protein
LHFRDLELDDPAVLWKSLHDYHFRLSDPMKLLFVDESGFSPNWTRDIEDQPFYVVAGICIDAELYPKACRDLRCKVGLLDLSGLEFPLGQGSEIKARDVARGTGWWANNNVKRNQFRNLMLGFPQTNSGVAFVVVIDKARHRNQYAYPQDPVALGMGYLFERVEWYLRKVNSEGFCVYDHDRRRTDQLHGQSMALIREGSRITFLGPSAGQRTEITRTLDHIVEVSLGVSENSLGLQVADFFATCAYCYFRDNQPANCGWWDLLCSALYREGDEVMGRGLKVFPGDTSCSSF